MWSKSDFEALFRSHYASLCDYAMTYVTTRCQAQDIVQDAFVVLWERRNAIDHVRSLRAYLFRSVRNRALDEVKRAEHTRRVDDHVIENTSAGVWGADHTLRRHQLEEAIQEGIENMSPRQWQVFTLSRHHRLTYDEIATVLGVSAKTVETHMVRALDTLRKRLRLHRGE
jgi:RNA polymerase sigma-70 factor (ECF subfamily)